jgi:hypothetical protein
VVKIHVIFNRYRPLPIVAPKQINICKGDLGSAVSKKGIAS